MVLDYSYQVGSTQSTVASRFDNMSTMLAVLLFHVNRIYYVK